MELSEIMIRAVKEEIKKGDWSIEEVEYCKLPYEDRYCFKLTRSSFSLCNRWVFYTKEDIKLIKRKAFLNYDK
jgi:hypothetical protein